MSDWHQHRLCLERDLALITRYELGRNSAQAVYVVLQSETRLHFCGEIRGMTSPSMGLWFKREIGSRWRENGPAMLINDQACEEEAGDFKPNAYNIATAIAVHELVHILQCKPLFAKMTRKRIDSNLDEIRKSGFSEMRTEEALGSAAFDDQFDDHDPNFFRLAFHAIRRLQLCGRGLDNRFIVDWDYYKLRPSQCDHALAVELDKLEAVPLSIVDTMPLPQQFLDLFNHRTTDTADVG